MLPNRKYSFSIHECDDDDLQAAASNSKNIKKFLRGMGILSGKSIAGEFTVCLVLGFVVEVS